MEFRETKRKQDWKLYFLFFYYYCFCLVYTVIQGHVVYYYSSRCSIRVSRYLICTCRVGRVWSSGVEIVVTRTSVRGVDDREGAAWWQRQTLYFKSKDLWKNTGKKKKGETQWAQDCIFIRMRVSKVYLYA